jgi:hypothetical protein
MAQIARKTARIFGSSALAAPLGIAQFGSKAAGSPTYSTDPAVIQALSQWLGGWNPSLVGGASPNLEDDNGVNYVHSYQIGYILQQGIAEYDAATTYFTNSFCSYGGIVYYSTVDNNIGVTPSLAVTVWKPYQVGPPNFWGPSDTGGSNNTYAIAVTNFPGNNQLVAGTRISFFPSHPALTGNPSTLAVNGQGTIDIKPPNYVASPGDPTTGQILTGVIVDLIYDGTNWVLLNPQ